ncbi:amphi-Trp domain-containing protein [Candidatus Nanohalobium constans]|uniref:Amphi-Trp domain-containing protein n=1 Tax=Candidatus Nanohalobium constans TaxID=2565781 RepID=A0A5Q0UG84_9ARCH|nr:amphi-Trp domain-containing protein [Candidatus Nanohalobium constans]QGA80628.1 amphi-Trp domain-containing protein [Candidatus Nanohalobium constans]
MSKEVDLDFQFSNDELANFLENFADKIREGEVGLSFKGKEEVQITPTLQNQLKLDFKQQEDKKTLELNIKLSEEIETTSQGRQKIEVEIV